MTAAAGAGSGEHANEAHGVAERLAARRSVGMLGAVVVGGCLLVATLNLVVNPLGYYPTTWFPPLTWSSRATKVRMMREAPPPDVLVLGSSRSMNLDAAEIERGARGRSFNAAVDSARAEDLLSLYAYAAGACGWRPREVVVGVDLEAFHDHLDPDPRLLATRALRAYLPRAMAIDAYERMASDLLSYPQTVQSLLSLRMAARGYPPAPFRFEPDGQLVYTDFDRQIVEGTFTPDIAGSIREYEGRFAGYAAPSDERFRLFRDLVERASASGARVRLFLTPLHPLVLEDLRRTRDFDRLHDAVFARLRDLSVAHPAAVSLRDYTEIASFGGTDDAFYDGAHMRPENTRRLVRALFSSAASSPGP